MTKKNGLLAGICFGVPMTIFFCFQDGILQGIIAGIIAGIFFGLCMYWFTNLKAVKRQTDIAGEYDGKVIFAGLANHFLNGEGVGGKLYLLEDKLLFKSHKLNIQNHELQVDVNHIKEVSHYNLVGIIPTGLRVTLDNGKTEKFVVNNRKAWIDEIKKAKETV